MKKFGQLNGMDVCISEHALRRMVEMQLTAEQITQMITDPDETYTSQKYPGTECFRVGDHALAGTKKDNCLYIYTVLYATRKAWLRASLDGLLGEDRAYYDNPSIPRF